MRSFSSIVLAIAASLIGQTLAAPAQIVQPGTVHDVLVTTNNTVNATGISSTTNTGNGTIDPTTGLNETNNHTPVDKLVGISAFKNVSSGGGKLQMSFVNNFGGGDITAYVTGLDSNEDLVMLQPDGTFFKPTVTPEQSVPLAVTQNVALPLKGQGQTTTITIPGYISAARVWFAAGGQLQFFVVAGAGGSPSLVEPSAVNPKDPSADVNWGFVELTNTEAGGLYANISYVDFVGLILGMSLTTTDGSGTQAAAGLSPDAVTSICNALDAQAKVDGQPWDQLCLADKSGKPLRVLAPGDYAATNPDAFADYFSNYIDQVWSHYTSNDLTIATQAAAGQVKCRVSGATLTCDGDNRGYAKPVASDIFGCNSGPFGIEEDDNDVHRAVVPRLCAAFDRSTLLIDGGDLQPGVSSTKYYSVSPTNYYSKFVHQFEVTGTGYAFAYDDVNPDGDSNQSGVVASAAPDVLTVTIGGPSGGSGSSSRRGRMVRRNM
ncbi:MAG: hypothetical protein Q9227_003817 [Pyrenula ochraceoflavens]